MTKTYFTEVSEYQTYANSQADFHFSYNANSGGGQSFLGGQFVNEKGKLTSPTVLDGHTGVFSLLLKGDKDNVFSILLNDEKGRYEIKPRGEGSNSMKLGVGTEKISPSKMISSLFMLPPTCTIKSPSSLDVSILTSNNYWLQSMWLKCNKPDLTTKDVYLIPIDFIFCGGSSKTGEGAVRYFELEAQKRIVDIISISEKSENLSEDLRQSIKVFSKIYTGETPFNYNTCIESTKRIMSLLANDYPTRYAGVEDPLPFLMTLLESTCPFSQNKLSLFPLQRIFYGAPGTGKSYKTNEVAKKYSTIRTTFHPDSDYSTFVGAYKPTTIKSKSYGLNSIGETKPIVDPETGKTKEESKIEYRFVKQAFLKAYVQAWKLFRKSESNEDVDPQFLVIEEINRGNCAQIFGDLFQLLDRKDGFSEYPIEADEDISKSLTIEDTDKDPSFGEMGLQFTDSQKEAINTVFNKDEDAPYRDVASEIAVGKVLVLPPNLYIWATMNTSDQSLFPIDSAFKRRWDWKYVRICEGKKKDGITPLNYRIKFVVPAKGEKAAEPVDEPWWTFVKAINKQIEIATKSEDKKLGYFFCKPDKKEDGEEDNTIISAETFVGKVVFYLWQDVFKDYGNRNNIFKSEGISFHDFYPEDMVANKDANPEGIDLELVKTFIKKVLDGNKEQPKTLAEE